jgi:hypothetical protein
MGDKAHVICVDGSKWSEPIAHDGEESNKDVVNYVYYIVFPAADVDPAN